MLGLYIHIPFCARRCPYCDFAVHIGARDEFVARYVAAIGNELMSTLRAARKRGETRELTSIYCGGGTPTFLSAENLNGLLALVREEFPIAEDAEISLEGNPENLETGKLCALREGGWNRLTLGSQSFDAQVLRFLGRAHAPHKIDSVVGEAKSCGWDNIGLDLIYGVPGQSRASWCESLQRAADLDVQQISCYSLTIEDGTNFGKRAARGELLPMHDDAQADMMQDTVEVLARSGFLRYEISNWSVPGRQSRHNWNYWECGDYLAAGCGAHGHLAGRRWWNERDAGKYIERIESDGTACSGEEVLSARQRFEEAVMLGLRTNRGICLSEISQRYRLDAKSELGNELDAVLARDVLLQEGEYLRLRPEMMSIADAVIARLLA